MDTPVDLMQATVQLEQTNADSRRTVGTGFLLSAPSIDGTPRILLVTANHVLSGMPGAEAEIGYRTLSLEGGWRYTPASLKIRDGDGAPLWARHPTEDVAVLHIQAPPQYARTAIPYHYLSSRSVADASALAPGDELLVLGFPRGVAANEAGFPILRSGRVASYPVSPEASPTFLLDFAVFPGNSGGPVFTTSTLAGANGPRIAGLLVQQLELNNERLEVGIVTHAAYIRETVEMVEGIRQPSPTTTQPSVVAGGRLAAHTTKPTSNWQRSWRTAQRAVVSLRSRAAQFLRGLSDALLAWIEPSPAGGMA